MENQRKITTLSFVRGAEDAIDLWPEPVTTGSYSGDNDVGRSRADELVRFMADNQDPSALGFVSEAIINRNCYGAVEIGFFSQIALCAMRGPQPSVPKREPVCADA